MNDLVWARVRDYETAARCGSRLMALTLCGLWSVKDSRSYSTWNFLLRCILCLFCLAARSPLLGPLWLWFRPGPPPLCPPPLPKGSHGHSSAPRGPSGAPGESLRVHPLWSHLAGKVGACSLGFPLPPFLLVPHAPDAPHGTVPLTTVLRVADTFRVLGRQLPSEYFPPSMVWGV